MAVSGKYISETEFIDGLGGSIAISHLGLNEASQQKALDTGENEFQSYVENRYVMPASVVTTPELMKDKILELVRYKLQRSSVSFVISSIEVGIYDKNIKLLERIREANASAPCVIDLVEKDRSNNTRAATPDLTQKQPVQRGRLEHLRPCETDLNRQDSCKSTWNNPHWNPWNNCW